MHPDASSAEIVLGGLAGSAPVPGRVARWAARTVRIGGSAVLAVGIAVFLFLAVGPRLFGYRTATMLTGSMVPTIRPGDVIVDTPEPIADLKVGQVVTYAIPVYDHHVESHRVISVKRVDGAVLFRTKGDANSGADPWTARVTSPTIWRVRTVVPWAGTAIRGLRAPLVSEALRIGIPATVVVVLLIGIWAGERRPGRRRARK